MLRPITEPAHVPHEIVHLPILVVRDEIPYCFIEVKSESNDDCGNPDADEPVKNSPAVHK